MIKKTDCQFKNQTGVNKTWAPSELNGADILVEDVQESIIEIQDLTAQVLLHNVKNSTIYIGGCEGSVFMSDSENVVIFVLSKQVRLRDCKQCTVYVACIEKPVIESCHTIAIGPFPKIAMKRQGGVGDALVANAKKINVAIEGNESGASCYDFSQDGSSVSYRCVSGLHSAKAYSYEFMRKERPAPALTVTCKNINVLHPSCKEKFAEYKEISYSKQTQEDLFHFYGPPELLASLKSVIDTLVTEAELAPRVLRLDSDRPRGKARSKGKGGKAYGVGPRSRPNKSVPSGEPTGTILTEGILSLAEYKSMLKDYHAASTAVVRYQETSPTRINIYGTPQEVESAKSFFEHKINK